MTKVRIPSRWGTVLLLGIVCIVSLPYLAVAFGTVQGRPVAPLDDAYITFQYARQIAQGQPYRYNDGEPPTTGMTSPLFGFLLAGFFLLGITGESLSAFAVGMGIIWLALSTWLTFRIVLRLVGEEALNLWPWAAAVLVALTGTIPWGCFNGMETGFFTVLTLAAVEAFLAKRIGWCVLWLILASLTRPEGQILAGLMWAILLVEQIICTRSVQWKRQILLTVAVLAGSVPMVVNWQLTGRTSSAGLLAKSWFYNVPAIPGDVIRSVWLSYRRILFERLMGVGARGQWFVPPGLLMFVLLGGAGLWLRRHWEALSLTVLWFFGGTLATATLITATWHLGRYQVPFIPVGIILATCGLAALDMRTARRWQRILLWIVVLVMLASSTYSTFHFTDLYRRAVSTVARQQLVISDWIRENLPANARVGVHDTGSLRYVGQRPTYDLIGLTTVDAAIAWRHGSGSVFELMEHSPIRPNYFAIYPGAFSIPYFAATDLFDEELFRVDVPDHAVASAGPVQAVWRADWHLADSGTQYYQPDVHERTDGLTLVDALDVADLDDEAAHNVVWWHDVRRPGFPTEVQQLAYRVLPEQVLDGGRLLTGGMSFDVMTRPQEPLWLVARLHAQEAGSVRVEVDGLDVGDWAYPPAPGQWLETVFRIPADAVISTHTHIALHVDTDSPHFLHYSPYYFWFLQGESEATTPRIEHRTTITFEGRLALVGFSLPDQAWHSGDTIPITLYWQATKPTQSDAKVFLHLYDTEGQLGPQSDGWAFRGTRPPYTWWPNEIVADPRLLALPPYLSPGRYSVEVGLYTPDDNVRLSAYRDGVHQAEERVPLTVIQIEE